MAVVLVILSLLIGGMILPLTAQREIHNLADTRKLLADISEALYGYAASHTAGSGKPYLPCPDTDGDGKENRPDKTCTSQEGTLPWADLGLGRLDAWNNPIRYRVSAAFSSSETGFSLKTVGDLRVCETSACTAVIAGSLPAVLVSHGKNGALATTNADEQANIDGNSDFVQHTQTDGPAGFDDIVTWLPPTLLFQRMVNAGCLP
jgi:type II secretory pathway pseudopilin PulG